MVLFSYVHYGSKVLDHLDLFFFFHGDAQFFLSISNISNEQGIHYRLEDMRYS